MGKIRILPLLIFALAQAPLRGAEETKSLADRLLDAAVPEREREKLIDANTAAAPALLTEMAGRIAPDRANEYELIPWIWRVANRSVKRMDDAGIRGVMEVSMPGEGEPLRDWQSVVLGGGVVMGIAEKGGFPARRLRGIMEGQDAGFTGRWARSLELAIAMSHHEPTPPPTRYDALRMLCVLPLERVRGDLTRYLAAGTEAEVQSGALYGLLDMDDDAIAAPVIEHLGGLAEGNRATAVRGLMRTPGRAKVLLEAVATGKVERGLLGPAGGRSLLRHADEAVRNRAAEVLGPGG